MVANETACCGFAVFAIIITIICLVTTSIVSVEDGEFAVTWHDITQEFHDTKGPGLHFMVPGIQSALYSRRVIAMTIADAECLTYEGVVAILELEAQYTYDEASLIDVFRTLGMNEDVQPLVDAVSRHAVIVACGNITATDLFTNRALAEATINMEVVTAINKHVPGVQGSNAPVRKISLPDTLVAELRKKDDMMEQVELNQSEREPILIEVITEMETAQWQAKSTIIAAEAEAEKILFKAQEDEQTVIAELESLATQLATGMHELNMTAEELLHEVLWAQQRGDEQSVAMQLCLKDCETTGFSCGICYLTNSGSESAPTLMISSP